MLWRSHGRPLTAALLHTLSEAQTPAKHKLRRQYERATCDRGVAVEWSWETLYRPVPVWRETGLPLVVFYYLTPK